MDIEQIAALRGDYDRDGVLLLKNALSDAHVDRARAGYDWSIANPGPSAFDVMKGTPGRFFTDTNNPEAFEAYRPFIETSPLPRIASALWDSKDVWFFYEQIFVKEGGDTARTPWHQDTSYAPIDGSHLMAFWMSFEPVAKAQALEFIPGTHHGPLYDGNKLDADDPLAPLYGDGSMPVLPNVDAERDKWDIVSFATQPNDVIVFHPSVLHGGGETLAGQARHTLTFKFFGPDAVVGWRPGAERAKGMEYNPEAPMEAIRSTLSPGDPFRHPAYPRIAV
jgi:ectoine hydroxylase-related dioxygenase (phytanoyl-CoA dioxygenase family)